MNRECLWGNGSNYHDGNEEGSEEIGPLGCFSQPRMVVAWLQWSWRYHYTKIDGVSYPAALADSLFFFRTMSCGTRFASFTLSEQLFLMLSYFSCRVENCWNKWLENLNCIHSWHWNWQIASFPHWNGKFITLRCRHAMQAGGMGCPHFILV